MEDSLEDGVENDADDKGDDVDVVLSNSNVETEAL